MWLKIVVSLNPDALLQFPSKASETFQTKVSSHIQTSNCDIHVVDDKGLRRPTWSMSGGSAGPCKSVLLFYTSVFFTTWPSCLTKIAHLSWTWSVKSFRFLPKSKVLTKSKIDSRIVGPHWSNWRTPITDSISVNFEPIVIKLSIFDHNCRPHGLEVWSSATATFTKRLQHQI